MKVLIVGANGMLGSQIVEELKDEFELIRASRQNSDIKVDITSPQSIKKMFETVGKIDALISAAGSTHFGSIESMTPELNAVSLNNKLAGQINLVLLGLDYINDNGSITLTSGVLMDDPVKDGASAAMANGGIKAFVKAAALDMPRGIRLNNVSPTILEESADQYGELFKGFLPVPGKRVALAYRKSLQGGQTGQTYEIY
ncbi:short chain dehydrogenase [Bacillus rubiinfantis]|uniref:short chain dehydrogenase n=1 Tax=Bacillus rubiinfantis TaxID=1499680 RepID=UPI0005A60B6B|nr:short chain dehydrogenase [Bacillus rubiinfantis]